MLKILVVDDNKDFRQSLVEILYKYFPDMEVFEAECGKEARQKLKLYTPNLIFMDIRLPDENGLEVSKQLKIHYPEIDIVVMSSFDLPEYRKAVERMGAKYFLAKESLTEGICFLSNKI